MNLPQLIGVLLLIVNGIIFLLCLTIWREWLDSLELKMNRWLQFNHFLLWKYTTAIIANMNTITAIHIGRLNAAKIKIATTVETSGIKNSHILNSVIFKRIIQRVKLLCQPKKNDTYRKLHSSIFIKYCFWESLSLIFSSIFYNKN